LNALHRIRRKPTVSAALLSIILSGCGGGGGGSAGNDPPPGGGFSTSQWPGSGNYVVVLKASGSTTAGATTTALSLVHPATPQVEYVMDSSPAISQLGIVLYEGSFDASSNRFTGLSQVAYVDAPGGMLRTTPLAANGSRPQQSTGPVQALCQDGLVANDFGNPFNSAVLATTPGADGTCGTADDSQVMIRFSSTGAPGISSAQGVVGYLRSSSTGAPAYWLMTDGSGAETAAPFGSGGNALVVGIGTPGVTSVKYGLVADLSDTLLYSRSGALMGLGYASGSLVRHTLATSTGPDGWKSAGNDANYAYAYLNSSTAQSGTGTWQLLAVARSNLAVTTIATGNGSIFMASALPGNVYATVLDASGTHVAKVSAPTGQQSSLWASSTTITAVEANPGGLNTVLAVSSASVTSLTLVDAQGSTLYSQSPGMVYGADSDAIDGASSDQVFAGVYIVAPAASTYLGGTPLTRFDAAAKTSTPIGTLPDGGALGGSTLDEVFVTPISADRVFGGFQASRLSGSQFVSSGSAVYTFNPGQANSLVRTTTQVH